MSVNSYWAYGLNIQSDLICPELPSHPHPTSAPDVTISLAASESLELTPLGDRRYDVRPGYFRLDVPGVARYSVEDGSCILIEPLPESSVEMIRLFLLGSTMGALLYQRGLFPLHGSAVETPWGAMVFVGAQGAGKSTLAAEFHRCGYSLLSDDVCAVQKTARGLVVLPAVAQVRLCADAYERLGNPSGARFDFDKFIMPMGEQYCPEPVPLKGIHVLSDVDRDSPQFEPIRGLGRVKCLLENLYRPYYLKGQRTQSELARMAGIVAAQAMVSRVTRRRNTTASEELVKFLELAWARHVAIPGGENRNESVCA
jgi:hypothetical protein